MKINTLMMIRSLEKLKISVITKVFIIKKNEATKIITIIKNSNNYPPADFCYIFI